MMITSITVRVHHKNASESTQRYVQKEVLQRVQRELEQAAQDHGFTFQTTAVSQYFEDNEYGA